MLTREHIRVMIEEGDLEGAEKALIAHPELNVLWLRVMLRKKRDAQTPLEPTSGVRLFQEDKYADFSYSVAVWASGGIGIRASLRN